MEPEKIRVLLATPPDGMEETAKKLELKLPVARDIRMQAMNLVLGKCVLCGEYTLAGMLTGMCTRCGETAPQRRMIPWSSTELLKKLDPSAKLLRQVCDQCHKPFMLSAGYLLRRLLLRRIRTSRRTCRGCFEKAKRAQQLAEKKRKRKEERQQKFELRKKAIEEERRRSQALLEARKRQDDDARKRQARQAFIDKRSAKLVYRPFADNKSLEKLKGELGRTHSRHRYQKGPKGPK